MNFLLTNVALIYCIYCLIYCLLTTFIPTVHAATKLCNMHELLVALLNHECSYPRKLPAIRDVSYDCLLPTKVLARLAGVPCDVEHLDLC